MKTKQAIEALKQGKRIKRVASDAPVNLYDHLDENNTRNDFIQLFQNDVVLRIRPDVSCAGKIVSLMMTLEQFEQRISYDYLNFDECQ